LHQHKRVLANGISRYAFGKYHQASMLQAKILDAKEAFAEGDKLSLEYF
jgi:hypothetical protein